ncbi:hypothetical protein ES705_18619 [subsurface metagenome]
MKKYFVLLFVVLIFNIKPAASQEVYSVSSAELLFQFAKLENPALPGITNNLRFTLFFHYGQYWHMDFTNNVGLFSGMAIRNVGFIYDTPDPTKTIRRSYTVGIPLALKLGAFDKHIYIMGGGEYELLFHYRARQWNSNDRDGAVIKEGEWFSDKTRRFVPSVFAGVQFPGGVNFKFKYYLHGFLNEDYVGPDLGGVSDFSDFTRQDMFYVSVSWQFRTDAFKNFTDHYNVAFTD